MTPETHAPSLPARLDDQLYDMLLPAFGPLTFAIVEKICNAILANGTITPHTLTIPLNETTHGQ